MAKLIRRSTTPSQERTVLTGSSGVHESRCNLQASGPCSHCPIPRLLAVNATPGKRTLSRDPPVETEMVAPGWRFPYRVVQSGAREPWDSSLTNMTKFYIPTGTWPGHRGFIRRRPHRRCRGPGCSRPFSRQGVTIYQPPQSGFTVPLSNSSIGQKSRRLEL